MWALARYGAIGGGSKQFKPSPSLILRSPDGLGWPTGCVGCGEK
jgi:hypothetical protein